MATKFGEIVNAKKTEMDRELAYLKAVGGHTEDKDGNTDNIYVFDVKDTDTINGCVELTITMYVCSNIKAMILGDPCWRNYGTPMGDGVKLIPDEDDMTMPANEFIAKAVKTIMKRCGVIYDDVLNEDEERIFRLQLKRGYDRKENLKREAEE